MFAKSHDEVNFAYHTVEGSSTVDKQALHQNLGDAEIFFFSIERNIQAFAELSHSLFPVSVFEKGIALLQQVAHQLSQEVLRIRRKESEKKEKRKWVAFPFKRVWAPS